ncbi:MAG: hypothetical protein WA941_13630 [Nitrososphaeraceae archaeon]
MDEGEVYNVLDDSNVDDIKSDLTFQRIVSSIICSDLDNYGFQVCQQGISDSPIPTEQTAPSSLDDTNSIFEDNDDDSEDNDSNGNDDDDENNNND